MEETEKGSPHSNTSVASPEFEFWMVRNTAFTQPQIHSADELFVNGKLLPLHLLNHQSDPDPEQNAEPEQEQNPEPEPSVYSTAESPAIPASKRWTDIFKLGDKKLEKKKERKNSSGSVAELNINIWPFSRSRSAGNTVGRPRAAGVAGRKACSAPCSRSNSGGESKTRLRIDTDEKSGEAVKSSSVKGRKWPSSPGRGGGVYLGKSSPVRPIRRHCGSAGKCTDRKAPMMKEESGCRRNGGGGGGGGGVTDLKVNASLCIGYRHNLRCNSDDNYRSSNGSTSTVNGSSVFNLRTLFSKKVY